MYCFIHLKLIVKKGKEINFYKYQKSNIVENIYSNKGSSSGNNRNEDKVTNALTTGSQQRAGTLNPSSPAPQSSDQAGLHLYYNCSLRIRYKYVNYFKPSHFEKSWCSHLLKSIIFVNLLLTSILCHTCVDGKEFLFSHFNAPIVLFRMKI